jgi:putative membrane protein
MMHFFDGGFYMGFGGIWMVLWWVVIIASIVLLVKWFSEDRSRPRDKTALEILKERYARGEINQAEFERMRSELER